MLFASSFLVRVKKHKILNLVEQEELVMNLAGSWQQKFKKNERKQNIHTHTPPITNQVDNKTNLKKTTTTEVKKQPHATVQFS